jgi:hypothetical protein
MMNNEDLRQLLETKATVYGSEGERIGTLGQIYLDDGTGLPHFATVKTGLFGSSENFVPLDDAEISDGQLYVKFTKHFVKDAPNIDPMGHLSPEDEDSLYDYYSQAGLGANRGIQEREAPTEQDNAEPVGLVQDTPLGAEEDANAAEGRAGRPRIRKYVVTDHQLDAPASQESREPVHHARAEGAYTGVPITGDPRRDVTSRNESESRPKGDRAETEDGPEMKRPHGGDRLDP